MPDHSFGPFINDDSRLLILGSFPSVKSREASFYYANPTNRFFKVLAAVFDEKTPESEIEKRAFLKRNHIALYDVIERCDISGSSDSSIKNVKSCDIMGLLDRAPIERIFLNGRTAEKYFNIYLRDICGFTPVTLPSTSAANARENLESLTEAYRIIRNPQLRYYDPSKASHDPEGIINDFYKDKNTCDAYLDMTNPAIPLIRFRSFDRLPFVEAYFTTRLGGVSHGVLSSMNLGFKRGDDHENVRKNYALLADRMDTDLDHIVMTSQIHESTILEADLEHALGTECLPRYPAVDGLYTDEKNIMLGASFADCVPIYAVNEKTGRIVLSHSGWRGTVADMPMKTALKAAENGNIEDVTLLIGPSIDSDSYEVTPDLIKAFSKTFSPEEMKIIARKEDRTHFLLDLWAACYFSARKARIPEDRIYFSSISTYQNADLLYSHRRSHGKRGNLNAFLIRK